MVLRLTRSLISYPSLLIICYINEKKLPVKHKLATRRTDFRMNQLDKINSNADKMETLAVLLGQHHGTPVESAQYTKIS